MNEFLPDFVGFVFYRKSKRYIDPNTASVLRKLLDERIKTVGVFVDEPIENIVEIARGGAIDLIQLHGSENSVYIDTLRKSIDRKIIKAFKIESEADISSARESTADFVLLDNGMGTGEKFDRSLIKNIGREFFLAGGLDEKTVGAEIEKFLPFCVDVSSSVEVDGKKSREKVKCFIDNVRKENENGK